MYQGYLLQDIATNSMEDSNQNSREVQLLAMISNKEFICYAIKVEGIDYLMLIDNKITLDFIESNHNIVVMEDNLPKDIKLVYILDHGLIQKTIGNITVTFVRYLGDLNQNNIIKYHNNYFSNVFNSILKDYENHLKELVNEIKGIKSVEIKILPQTKVCPKKHNPIIK